MSDAASFALHAERRGSGPPLILIHGGVGSSNHWVRNIAPLSAHFSVFAFDMPGFGKSPSVPRDIGRDDYLRLCVDGIAAVVPSDEPLRLVGFSFGGVVGAHVAAELGDRMAKVSLMAPGGIKSVREREPDYERMPPRDAPDEERRAVIRRNLLRLMLHYPESADDAAVDLQAENIRNTRFPSIRVSRGEYLLDDLRRIRCPLQMVLAELDTKIYPSIDDRIAYMRQAADFRVDIVPDAGHWMQFERADATNRVLLDFLTG